MSTIELMTTENEAASAAEESKVTSSVDDGRLPPGQQEGEAQSTAGEEHPGEEKLHDREADEQREGSRSGIRNTSKSRMPKSRVPKSRVEGAWLLQVALLKPWSASAE